MRGSSGTIVLFHSLVKLPETPMRPRLFDQRVGYFTDSLYDYGRDEHRGRRARLHHPLPAREEGPDGGALRAGEADRLLHRSARPRRSACPTIKKGVEDWQPAFEAAGFKNAIVAKEAPSSEQDPDWDPEDARYSVDPLVAIDD